MRVRKRILAAALSVAMVCSLAPADFNRSLSVKADAEETGGITYDSCALLGSVDDTYYYLEYKSGNADVDPSEGVQYQVVTSSVADATIPAQITSPTVVNTSDYEVQWITSTGVVISSAGKNLKYEDVAVGDGVMPQTPSVPATYRLQVTVDDIDTPTTVDITVASWKAAATVGTPQTVVYAERDSSATFRAPEVTPDGSGKRIKYSWYRKYDNDWISLSGSSSYYTDYDCTANQQYRCVITAEDYSGNILQVNVVDYELRVIDELPIGNVSVSDRMAYLGQNLTIVPNVDLRASASEFDIKYSWAKSENGSYVEVATTPTYNIPAVEAANYTGYRLTVAAYIKGTNDTMQSKTGYFELEERGPYTINRKDEWSGPSSETVDNKTTYHYYKTFTKTLGEELSLEVNLKPADGWTLAYNWFKGGISAGITTNTYTVPTVTTDAFGSYTCRVTATNAATGGTYDKDVFEFTVNETAGIRLVTKTETKQTSYVSEGTPFSLKASDYEAGGSYTLAYQWAKYNTETGKWGKLEGKTTTSLDFATVEAADYGRYRVTVTASRADGTAITSINAKKEIFTIRESANLKLYRKSNATMTQKVGDQVTMQVKAEVGSSEKYGLTYQWYYNGTAIPNATADTLTKALTKDDFGTYRCDVTAKLARDSADEGETASCSFRVILDTGFEVKTPSSNVLYGKKAGEEVTLSVDAVTGNEQVYPLTYKWYKIAQDDYRETGDPQVIDGATAKDLKVTLKDDSDFAYYRCTVSNGAQDKNVTFKIVKDDGFYAVASGQTSFYKKVGDSVAFAVKAGSDDANTKMTYQWYYYGTDTDDYRGNADYDENDTSSDYWNGYQKITGATQATYAIDALKKGQLTQYLCEVTDNLTKETKTVEFWVTESNGLKIYESEDVRRSYYLNEGGAVSFGVTVENPENANLLYRWYFNEDTYGYGDDDDDEYTLNSRVSVSNNDKLLDDAAAILNLANITKEQFGIYKLRVYKDSYDTTPVYSNYYLVNKRADDLYVTAKNGARTFRRAIGESVTFNVEAETKSGAAITYQWFRGDDALYGETNPALTLTGIKESDFGSYTCRVTVGEGDNKVTKTIIFYLHKKTALQITWDSFSYGGGNATKYIKAALGTKAELAVTATADAESQIAYQWFRYDKKTDSREVIYNATAANYAIASVTKDDYTLYTCKVTDGSVTEEVSFRLTADDGLKLKRDYITYVEIAKGQTAQLTANASCATGFNLSYQWYYYDTSVSNITGDDNWVKIDGATAASYTTPAINFNYFDATRYKCDVQTDAGNVITAVFTVVEKGALGLKVEADKEGVVSGGTVTYKATVTNPDNLALTYQWYAQNEFGTYDKIDGATAVTYKAKMPTISDVYDYRTYVCIAKAGVNEDDEELIGNEETLIVAKPAKMNKLPASTTKDETNVQGYSVSNATSLKVSFDTSIKLAEHSSLTVIDASGSVSEFEGDDLTKTTLSLKGSSAYFLFKVDGQDTMSNPAKTGYKVKAVAATIKKTTTTKKLSLGLKEKYSVKLKGAKYSTNKKKVAAVSKTGVITAKKTGKAKITVKTSNKTIIYQVTVKKAPKKIAKVTPAKKTLKVKKSVTIKVKLPKGTASGKITYKSSNKKVATVNAKGKVTAKKKGKAKITVKTYNGKKKVVKITVKK